MNNELILKQIKESLIQKNLKQESLLIGTVLDITKDYIILDLGLKSEGWIPLKHCLDKNNNIEVNIGTKVNIVLENIDDGSGCVKISRDKAKKIKIWDDLENAYNMKETVKGIILNKIKGGYIIDLKTIKAFLPNSLASIKQTPEQYLTTENELEFKIIKFDRLKNNIVLSRKIILEIENEQEKIKLIEKIKENQVIKGIVKNITSYGAFVDLGGLDGLLHITDITWKRIKTPAEILKIGQEIDVLILKFDKATTKISLGMKQLEKDPWSILIQKYKKGSELKGKITNITDYGCFVEIENGVEGLIHISELEHLHKYENKNKQITIGTEIEVTILLIDEKKRKISLTIKQLKENPIENFKKNYKKGDTITGIIKSITEFGIFVELTNTIDGLIHLSDLTWEVNKQQELKKYKKNSKIEAIILNIDDDKERISLGIKQLIQDPFLEYINKYQKGSIILCKIIDETDKHYIVQILEEKTIQSIIKKTDIKIKKYIGDELEVKITAINKKTRSLNLTTNTQTNKETVIKNTATLGDLIKQKLNTL